MRTFGVLTTFLLIAASSGSAAEDPATVQSLVETLRGHDPAIAGWAAMSLGRLGEKGVNRVPALIEALSDQRPIDKLPFAATPVGPRTVAAVAGDALAAMGESAVPALADRLDEPRDEIREKIIVVLARIGPAAKRALPKLREIATGPGDRNIRYVALYSLGAIGPAEESHVELFRSQLADENREIRGLAIQTLGRLGDRSRPAVADLIRLLDDREARTESFTPDFYGELPLRHDAAEALGRIGAEEAVPPLERMMRDESDDLVAAVAAVALVRIQAEHSAARSALLTSIQGEPGAIAESATAINAVATLGKNGRWALQAINSRRSDPSNTIREAVVSANGAIGGPESPAILVAGLSDPDEGVRFSAALAFRSLGDEGATAVPALIALLRAEVDEDPSDVVDQDDVVEALGWMGKSARPAIPAIEDWARRQTIPVWREKASEAIERIRSADRS